MTALRAKLRHLARIGAVGDDEIARMRRLVGTQPLRVVLWITKIDRLRAGARLAVAPEEDAYGVDVSFLRLNLNRTPAERLIQGQKAAKQAIQLRNARKLERTRPPGPSNDDS
ncbi:MAG: hypothetical protein MH204_06490 [Fimbriimonadaceae bacterium]|nr:hypothetical protein [Fimbriimonadaceae bacterium]